MILTKVTLLMSRVYQTNLKLYLAEALEQGDLEAPHRSAQFLSQLAQESDGFRALEEYASGEAYEGRRDLGNTEPGDGVKFKGRTPIMLTGRANYRAFAKWWGDDRIVEEPTLVLEWPTCIMVPVWYWKTRDLNKLADEGEHMAITRRINGGLNGLKQRRYYLVATSLVLLGYEPENIHQFQEAAGLIADGIAGPITRAALHRELLFLR